MTTIYCDGAGWNGHVSRFCVATDDGESHIEVLEKNHTNNEMEYAAVSYALANYAVEGCTVYTDSLLVVNQVSGEWAIRQQKFFGPAMRIRKKVNEMSITLAHIGREHNVAGKLLEGTK